MASRDVHAPPSLSAEQETEPSPAHPSFWTQLRFKIVAPYLILALILAVAGTYFLARVFAERLHERSQSQLREAGYSATDEVVYTERELLTSLRAIARTQGVSAAVVRSDLRRLYGLVYPIAVNDGLEFVEIAALDGTPLLSLHRTSSLGYPAVYTPTAGLFRDWSLVQRVAAGDEDDIGDKFAGMVQAPWGWCFYIGGPIRDLGRPVGVVLVGVRLPALAQRMAGRPANGQSEPPGSLPAVREITVYSSDGQVVATTFQGVASSTLQISPQFYAQVLEGQELRYAGRQLTVDGQAIEEAFVALEARHGADLGVFGVAMPAYQQEQSLTQVVMALFFSLAVVAIVLVGIWISAQVVRPVLELVRAARRVEGGDLSRKVVVRTGDEIGLLGHAFNRMVQGLRVKEFIHDAFGRFVSRDVADALLRGSIRMEGEKRVASMLFADIRDFTRLSEQLDPTVMVKILNDYFTAMVEEANTRGGTVNKFGGDSTLVIFGAPVDHPDHADRAVQAALGMRRRLAQLNAERLTRGEVPIRMGIGINTGEVVAGTVGSRDRMEYTVIGDPVNLSARVQGLNKEFPEYDILISVYTRAALCEQDRYVIRNLGPMSLKGKSEAVDIFAVIGLVEPSDGQRAGT